MADGSKWHSCGLSVLRIVVGVVFALHGWQKIHVLHLATVSAVVLITVEFLGGILLITGLATRGPAVLLAVDMIVAIITVHMKHGFFAQNGGYEFPLTLLAALICLAISGGGSFSRKGW
jgi:putative oxidoreductase